VKRTTAGGTGVSPVSLRRVVTGGSTRHHRTTAGFSTRPTGLIAAVAANGLISRDDSNEKFSKLEIASLALCFRLIDLVDSHLVFRLCAP
jgi:hypothetical protein